MKKSVLVCLLLIGMVMLTGCQNDNSKLEKYLKDNNYTKSGECWTKDIVDGESTKTVKYCLSECKYYSEDSTMNDKFVLDISTLDMTYQYSFMLYTYKSSSATSTCLYNDGKKIAKDDYTCKLATSLAYKHLELFKDVIIDKLDVKPKNVCK